MRRQSALIQGTVAYRVRAKSLRFEVSDWLVSNDITITEIETLVGEDGPGQESIYRRSKCILGSQVLVEGLASGDHDFQIRSVSPGGESGASNSVTLTVP